MRGYVLAVLVAGVMATGCKDRFFQTSVHPFVDPIEAPGDLAGRWLADDDGGALVFVPSGPDGWRVLAVEVDPQGADQEECLGVVHFGRAGGTLFWDMTAEPVPSDGLAREHVLALHSVARVRLEGDTMEIALLQPDWIAAALADGRLALAHFQDEDGGVVLAAPRPELEAFLQVYGDDPGAFGLPQAFHRGRDGKEPLG